MKSIGRSEGVTDTAGFLLSKLLSVLVVLATIGAVWVASLPFRLTACMFYVDLGCRSAHWVGDLLRVLP